MDGKLDEWENTAYEWLNRLHDPASWMNEMSVDRLADGLNDPRMRDMMALALIDPGLDAPALAGRARDAAILPDGMEAMMRTLHGARLTVRPDRGRLIAARDAMERVRSRRPDCTPAAMDLMLLVFWLAGDRHGLGDMLARPLPDTAIRVVVRFAMEHGMWPAGVDGARTYTVSAI